MRIGENALFRLAGAPIVVRIARSVDYWSQVEKEIAVAEWLGDVGYPAARSFSGVRQPLCIDGHPVTFWKYIDEDKSKRKNQGMLAHVLREFHALAVPADVSLPEYNFDERVFLRLNKSSISSEDKEFLFERFETLRDEVERLSFPLDRCVVHGDAHLGNVMLTSAQGPVLIDFENVGIGHREWDLSMTATAYVTAGWLTDEDYSLFAETYGYDVMQWVGFDVLRQVHEIKMTTWLMQNVNNSAEIAKEFDTRMRAIRSGHSDVAWKPF
jgi:aminoglycoside phosphotransferase